MYDYFEMHFYSILLLSDRLACAPIEIWQYNVSIHFLTIDRICGYRTVKIKCKFYGMRISPEDVLQVRILKKFRKVPSSLLDWLTLHLKVGNGID